MRSFYKIAIAAIACISVSAACYAVDVKVKITGIKDAQGTVYVAAYVANPEKLRGEMAAVAGDTAELVLKDVAEGKTAIYVYVDANANAELDLGDNNIPLEGCAIKKVKINPGMDTVEIPLQYYMKK